jgi:hypothetical protein
MRAATLPLEKFRELYPGEKIQVMADGWTFVESIGPNCTSISLVRYFDPLSLIKPSYHSCNFGSWMLAVGKLQLTPTARVPRKLFVTSYLHEYRPHHNGWQHNLESLAKRNPRTRQRIDELVQFGSEHHIFTPVSQNLHEIFLGKGYR